MTGITYIIFPGGTGGNFLKDLLCLDKTPLDYTPKSFRTSLNRFLTSKWMHHLINGSKPTEDNIIKSSIFKEYVKVKKHLVVISHYSSFINHRNLQPRTQTIGSYWESLQGIYPDSKITIDDINTLAKRQFLEHKMVENIIIIKCTTKASLELLSQRRSAIGQYRLTNIEKALNNVLPTHIMEKYAGKKILCVEFSELCRKETYLQVLKNVNEKFKFSIPLKECESFLEMYYKNKFHTRTTFN